MANFGQKFIGVDINGSLEIHGREKRSWTRLTRTLGPKRKLYDTAATADGQPATGFTFYEFDREGKLVEAHYGQNSRRKLERTLDKVIAKRNILNCMVHHCLDEVYLEESRNSSRQSYPGSSCNS